MPATSVPPPSADPRTFVLQAESVRVQFGPLRAVNDVSLQMRGGDIIGLIGPNGAGKTTLLRALAGLQPMRVGRVSILGLPLSRESMRHIAFTPDTPVFYEELTVRKFLSFIAMGYDLPGGSRDEAIDFWIEKVWLKEKADQKIKQLSRGMRQRVGLARSLLPNPAVVLLDEPAAGLDPAGRVQFRQLLCDLREQGKALIVSSHILADMNEYCTHIGIMSAGRMIQLGTVDEIAHAHTVADRCRYAIVLSRPFAQIVDRIAGIVGVDNVHADTDRLTLEFGKSRDDASKLLAELVRREVPVASFAPLQGDLEDAYLRTGIAQVD